MPAKAYIAAPEVLAAGNANVGDFFTAQVELHGERIALEGDGESLTYAELNQRTERLARVLAAHGLENGGRVALMSRNSTAFIETELAAAKAGAISVGLNWRLSPAELKHCLALTEPGLLICQPEYAEQMAGITDAPTLIIGESYETALTNAAPISPSGGIAAGVGTEDGVVIIFTSGTTGPPKGALISHRATIARTLIYAAETGAPANDTFVAWTPLFHMGANDFALATLLRGGRVVIIDGYQPEALIAAIEQHEIHYLPVVPGMITEFIEVLQARHTKPKGIGIIGAMPDLIPRQQLAEITQLLDAPYLNTFGSTETGICPATGNTLAIGKAPTSLSKRQNNFCEIKLVDADDNRVPDGTPGELAIRGPSLFSGYWRNDAANAEAFRGGWFHMGDVFRRNGDGSLDFIDRVKYMIKSGAENIYPAEIEQHVLADPRIADAVVVRRPDPRWGEVPVVFAARREGASLSEAEVIETCRGKLAGFKLPKEVHFIAFEDFPRSSSGKILRHELEKRLG